MLNETYTGSRFRRLINKHLPFRWGSYCEYTHIKYQTPDVLDYHLPQPGGIVLHFKGPRNDVDIVCDTPKETIPFQTLSPEGTTMSIYDTSIGKYTYIAHIRNQLIEIPSDFPSWGEREPIHWLLHEIGHLWSIKDETWEPIFSNSEDLLNDRSIPRNPWNEFLPVGYERRKQELEAEKIKGQEERRADILALYIVGSLKRAGFDLLPGLNISVLERMFNQNIGLRKEHCDEPGFDFRFSTRDVSAIMSGELPWPHLKKIVDTHLAQVLPKN